MEIRHTRADGDDGIRLLTAYLAEMRRRTPSYDPARGSSANENEMAPPTGCFFVAVDEDVPLGCVGLKRLDATTAEVKRLYVSPQTRGRGISRALMTALEIEATRLGYTTLRLDTGPNQPEALSLYRASGYVEIGDFNANANAAYWFEKTLDTAS